MSKQDADQAQVDVVHYRACHKAVLYVLKHCAPKDARIEYGILLAALAPERLALAERAAGGNAGPPMRYATAAVVSLG